MSYQDRFCSVELYKEFLLVCDILRFRQSKTISILPSLLTGSEKERKEVLVDIQVYLDETFRRISNLTKDIMKFMYKTIPRSDTCPIKEILRVICIGNGVCSNLLEEKEKDIDDTHINVLSEILNNTYNKVEKLIHHTGVVYALKDGNTDYYRTVRDEYFRTMCINKGIIFSPHPIIEETNMFIDSKRTDLTNSLLGDRFLVFLQ